MTNSRANNSPTALANRLTDISRGSELTLTLESGETLQVQVDKTMVENSRTERYITVFPTDVAEEDRTTHFIYCYSAFTEDANGDTIVDEGNYRTVNLKKKDAPYPSYIADIVDITIHSTGGTYSELRAGYTETAPARIRELIATLQPGDRVLFSTEGRKRAEYHRVTRTSEKHNFAMVTGPRGGTYSLTDMAPRPPMLQTGSRPVPLESVTLLEAYDGLLEARKEAVTASAKETTAYSGRAVEWVDGADREAPFLLYERGKTDDTVLEVSHATDKAEIHISGSVTTSEGESALVLEAPSDAQEDIERLDDETANCRPAFDTHGGWLIDPDAASYVIDFLTGDFVEYTVSISPDWTFSHPQKDVTEVEQAVSYEM